jgi:cbb3-type cytochrome oxidase subunit 1
MCHIRRGEGGRGYVDEGKVRTVHQVREYSCAHIYDRCVYVWQRHFDRAIKMKNLGYSTVHVYMLGVCMRVGALCKDITSKKWWKHRMWGMGHSMGRGGGVGEVYKKQ